ncbi:unnamed protein product, partial [Closterium sp. NIES-54]
LCGDFVIHPEFALLCLTGLVTPCFPTCTQHSFSSFIPVSSHVVGASDLGGAGGHDKFLLHFNFSGSINIFGRCSNSPSAPPLGPLATAPATAATATATATATPAAAAATAAPQCCATMASLRVLAFDHEGRPVAFDTWHDDLQLYLLSDIKDSVSLFDHVSSVALAPHATADRATRSQWLSRPVRRYSSPATAALGRLLLPYLFPELSAFATVTDLVTHLRTSNARYRATVLAEFLATNQSPMFITLYFIVSRLPDSLHSVRDHFLYLDPTSLTVDLLEKHLLAGETSAAAVGAARGTPRPPFFEGCSPSPLSPSFASAAAADVSVTEDVTAASTSAKRRSSKGKGGRGGGGGSGGGGGGNGSGGGGSSGGGGGIGGGGGGGTGGESGGSSGGGGGSGGSGGGGGGGTGGGRSGPRCGGPGGGHVGQTCGKFHTEHRCFSCLDDAWRAEFGDDVERPHWVELLRSGVAIFDLDYDAIISAMYALSFSAKGDYYRCVPPDPGIAAAALGASASGTPPGTAPAEALHTFTLDSGASRCFFRDSTTLTPLPAPVPVELADPSGGPVVARSSTILAFPAIPSGSLSGLHLPSFSTNLVSTTALQDAVVTTTTPRGQRVSICTCTRTGRHLTTFTRRPGSSLYTLATEPPQVAASAQVSASGQVAASCSCRLLSQLTLLWHHRLGHPSLPRLCGMHSRFLVSGLPRSLPPLPLSPAPPCFPCVEGRQRAALHSSFPLTSAPLQTLHMDVWGPARVSGEGRERYFLLVVDDYTRYTTVFPLLCKGEVVDVLISWIRTVRLQLRERFGTDLPVLRLHSDKGGEFSSDLLRDLCRGEGILLSFTLPDSPQQNGIAERRIGLVMEVTRTSMIHAAAPHFLWPFAVRYAAHHLNLWPRVSLPETSPTLCWTGNVGDASVFRDVTFDESVPFYRLFPYCAAPPLPPPLFLAPGPPPVDPLPPRGLAPSGVSHVDPLPGTAPVQVAVGSGAAPGTASGGATSGGEEPGGAGSEGVGPGGAEPEGVEPGGAESEGAESGGAAPRGAASSGGPAGASPRLTLQQLREWLVRCAHRWSGAPGAGGAGDNGAGGAAVTAGAGGTGGAAATGPGGARTSGAGAAATGRALELEELELEALAQEALELPELKLEALALELHELELLTLAMEVLEALCCRDRTSFPCFSRFFVSRRLLSDGLTESREPASRPVLPVRTARHAPRSRPPSVPGMHSMALRPSSVPLRVPLPAPPESSLPEVPDPESNCARAASPTVSRLLTTAVSDPSFDPPSVGGECSLGTDVLDDRQEDFECLAAAVPRFASMLLAPEGDPDAPDIPTPRSYAEASTGPYSSQWQAAMDAEMAFWKSTGTYVDEVPPPRANIVDGMWIFRVKRPPGSPPAFKARYVARGFSQRQGVDYFQTFSPTPKMTTLRVLLHVAAQRDYELHSLDFSTAFLQSSLHEEIWLRRPPGLTGTFPAGTQWSLRRPFYGRRQAPREWHDTLRTTLGALGFAPSTADPSLFLRTDTSLPPFYVLVYVNDLVFATADTEALTLVKSELQKRHTCTDLGELRSYLDLQITAHHHTDSVTHGAPGPSALRLPVLLATAHSSVYQPLALSSTFRRVRRAEWYRKAQWDAAKRVLRYLCSTSGMGLVLGGRGPVVLTGHADASWVDDSATQRSSQGYTFSLDNKAMISLCQEHRLEHRTKHVALRYFLARELQQRGQLRLAYVATRANTADVFTKALPPGDHQRFATVLGLVPTLPHLITA